MVNRDLHLLVNGFFDANYFKIVKKVMAALPVSRCTLIYLEKKPHLPIPAIYLDRDKIFWEAKYPLKNEEMMPLDEPLIQKMRVCELTVLNMMNRMEKRRELSYDERKKTYLAHLRYWNHVLTTTNIDLFLSSGTPHEIYDYIIYCLCRVKHIPAIFMYEFHLIYDLIAAVDNWQNPFPSLAKEEKITGSYNLPENMEAALQKQLMEKEPRQFWVKTPPGALAKIFSTIKNYYRKISQIKSKEKLTSLLKDEFNYFKNKYLNDRRLREIKKYYDRYVETPDISQKYIYVSLHLQPEMSTSPLAGVFVDQLLMVQILSYCLPRDVYLFVKEHPMQKWIGRSQKFYDDLHEVKNVVFVPQSFSSFKLIENCLAVATATGTSGWEALFRKKSVLMFGNNFYQYLSGVYQIRTLADCQAAVTQILQGGKTSTPHEIRTFLARLSRLTTPGVVDPAYRAFSRLSEEENCENVSRIIIKKIRQYLSI